MTDGRDTEVPGRSGGQGSMRPSPLRMLRDRARLFLQERITTVLERVDETFFDLAESAENANEQTIYFDAMRLLRMKRTSLESEFIAGVSEGFDGLGSNGPSPAADMHASQLQVLDNDELEEMIAFDNMVTRATEKCQPELDFVNRRLSHVMRFPVVEKRNPLCPELISEVFARG